MVKNINMECFKGMKEEAKNAIINELNDGYNEYLCNLHDVVFDMYDYVEDTDKAEEILSTMNIFAIGGLIDDYEMSSFGELPVISKYDDPIWVLDTLWYIIGESVLSDLFDGIEIADGMWDSRLTWEESEQLAKQFEKVAIL